MNRIIRGIGALIVLAIIYAGIPTALILFAGNPLPEDLGRLVRPDIGGNLLMTTWLPLLAWAAWAVFAVQAFLELLDQLRNRAPRTAPAALRLPQAFNRTLISAVLALFAVGGAVIPANATEAEAATEHTIAQSYDAHSTTVDVNDTEDEDSTPTDAPTVAVSEGDTLWSLAEHHLGDGKRWVEIMTLNEGVTQDDGHALSDAMWINAGWILELPADADTTDTTPQGTVVVEAGDTLSSIAENALGDESQWTEIADANDLSDADSIDVGEVLTLPNDSTPDEPAEAETPEAEPNQQDEAAAVAPSDPDTNALTNELDDPTTTDTTAAIDEDDADVWPIATTGGIGAILAAGILSVLGIRRLKQRRARRTGERIAMPDPSPSADLELELRAVEAPYTLDEVDAALRYLAVWAQDSSNVLPQLYAIRLAEDEIALYLDHPAQLPEPFTAVTDDDMAWIINPSELPEPTRIPSAPYPALVSLGHDATGAHLLIDLEHAGALNLEGEPEIAQHALTALALELATSRWSEDVQITLVGLAHGLPEMLGTGRVRHVDDVDTLIRNLTGQAEATRATLEALGVSTIEEARGLSPEADAWVPEIVLLGDILSDEHRSELAHLVTLLPRLGIAAVAKGHLAGEWVFEIQSSDAAELHLPGDASLPLTPQLVSPAEYQQVADLFLTTDEPATPAPTGQLLPSPTTSTAPASSSTDPWSLVLAEALPSLGRQPWLAEPAGEATTPPTAHDIESTTPAAAAPADDNQIDDASAQLLESITARPYIRLLGTVALTGARGEVPLTPKTDRINNGLVQRTTELAAFLALHPGSTTDELHNAIWPGKDPSGSTAAASRNKLVSQLRKWLGNTDSGTPYVPRWDGTYSLHPDVTTDWQILLQLIDGNPATASTAHLTAALDLIDGQPLSAVKRGRWGWAERLREEMIATTNDLCHELATRALAAGDHALARRAAGLGRYIDPINEVCWRDALETELAAGDHDRFDRITMQLSDVLTDLEEGYEPEPETQELIEQGQN